MQKYRGLLICGLLVFLTITQKVQAGLLLEPYLGYVSGKQTSGSASANFTGTELGTRVGYSTFNFSLGADYITAKYTDDSSSKNDLTMSDLGIFASYKFPILLRVFATYVPSSQLKGSAQNILDYTYKGNTTRLGVGFTGFPIININLEYITATYKDLEVLGQTTSLSSSVTTSAYALSISVPFDLF